MDPHLVALLESVDVVEGEEGLRVQHLHLATGSVFGRGASSPIQPASRGEVSPALPTWQD